MQLYRKILINILTKSLPIPIGGESAKKYEDIFLSEINN